MTATTTRASPAAAGAPGRTSPVRAWVLAARPATLTAALVPVVIGSAVAWSAAREGGTRVRVIAGVAALLGAMLIQIGTNLANDVFDFEKGADTAGRLGPVRATQAGLLTPAAVRRGMFATFALAVLVGAYLTAVAGPVVVAIGVFSIASGVAYTAGPYPLAYLGLGDVFVFCCFGLLAVCGTAFVELGAVPPLALVAAIPVGAIATAVLVVNNVRDEETDRIAKKRTVVVRFGRRFGVAEYVALMAIAYATPIVLLLSRIASPWVALPLATLPIALGLGRQLRDAPRGSPIPGCLEGTARLLLAYGALFAIGLAAPR